MKSVMKMAGWGDDKDKSAGQNVDQSSVVGLPGAHHETATVDYKDANITSAQKKMEVSGVQDRTVQGQAVEYQEETVSVPRTEMRKETIQVPETRMETQTVERPVTVTKPVQETVKDIEMQKETVEREVVHLDKEEVEVPTTRLAKVAAEEPVLETTEVRVHRPDEKLKEVKVVRPDEVMRKVMVKRPVERTRKYTVQRPETIKKTVTVQQPVQVVDEVTLSHPEVRDETTNIKVPHEEHKTVTYQKPVTVIRPAEGESLVATEESRPDPNDLPVPNTTQQQCDWNKVPVGLPFTEMQEASKDFTVRTLEDKEAVLHRTWMVPVKYNKLDYKMEPVEVEITETVWQETEMEIVETVLEEFEEEVKVSVMNEVTEQWPVVKGREEIITTQDVVMQPSKAVMPELTMKTETREVPRKEIVTEEIEKPVQVEREVTVNKATTEMQQVSVEVPVQHMRDVEVERPHLVHDKVTTQVPKTVATDVNVQSVQGEKQTVTEQSVTYGDKTKAYQDLQTDMKPTAIGGKFDVDPATKYAEVDASDLASAEVRAKNLREKMNAEGVQTTTTGEEKKNIGAHAVNV